MWTWPETLCVKILSVTLNTGCVRLIKFSGIKYAIFEDVGMTFWQDVLKTERFHNCCNGFSLCRIGEVIVYAINNISR